MIAAEGALLRRLLIGLGAQVTQLPRHGDGWLTTSNPNIWLSPQEVALARRLLDDPAASVPAIPAPRRPAGLLCHAVHVESGSLCTLAVHTDGVHHDADRRLSWRTAPMLHPDGCWGG